MLGGEHPDETLAGGVRVTSSGEVVGTLSRV